MYSRFDSLAAAFDSVSIAYEYYPPPQLLGAAIQAVSGLGDLNIITRYDPADILDAIKSSSTYERIALDELSVVPIQGCAMMHVGKVDREVVRLVVTQSDHFAIIMKGAEAIQYADLFPAGTMLLVTKAPVPWRRCIRAPEAPGALSYDTLCMYVSRGVASSPALAGSDSRLGMVGLEFQNRN